MNLVKIKFRPAGKLYDFDGAELDVRIGEKVVVETGKGLAIGKVVGIYKNLETTDQTRKLKKVVRSANAEDIEREQRNAEKEKWGFEFCNQKIIERKLPMKLTGVEFLPDGSRVTFYFTADGRVDFRELVKDLAREFHTRIQMRQIGVRDEAKLLGGIGCCGRELCCCSFLRDFVPVSIKVAKDQSIALNPTRVSGMCGRLMCCLTYERETYLDMGKGMPLPGMRVVYKNEEVLVKNINTLKREVTIELKDQVIQVVKVEELDQKSIEKQRKLMEEIPQDAELKKLEEGVDHVDFEENFDESEKNSGNTNGNPQNTP